MLLMKSRVYKNSCNFPHICQLSLDEEHLMGWDDEDAINHVPLRMRITNLT
jgi:hypothetical protein